MTTVRYVPYTNRLAKLIRTPGGKRIAEALTDANANLKSIEGPCLTVLDELIARIRTLAGTCRPNLVDLEEIYGRSNEIVGLGGVFDMRDLSAAAYSLCELVDRTRDGGGPSTDALLVHVNSLRLLRQGDQLGDAGRREVLDGLAGVVRQADR